MEQLSQIKEFLQKKMGPIRAFKWLFHTYGVGSYGDKCSKRFAISRCWII